MGRNSQKQRNEAKAIQIANCKRKPASAERSWDFSVSEVAAFTEVEALFYSKWSGVERSVKPSAQKEAEDSKFQLLRLEKLRKSVSARLGVNGKKHLNCQLNVTVSWRIEGCGQPAVP